MIITSITMFENCCSCFDTSSSDTEDEAENRRIKKNIAKKGKTTSVLDKKPFTPKPTSSKPSICSGGSPASSSKITILKRPGFEEEFLNEHNRLRALHGCPPLTLNQEMNNLATDWCIRMANKNKMKHSNQDKYGENLFMSVGYSIYGKKVVQTWYEEIMDYNFYKPGYNEKTSNFTQIVWKNTREMGVGQERRENTTWVTVLYYPPGNRHKKYEANVPKLLKRDSLLS